MNYHTDGEDLSYGSDGAAGIDLFARSFNAEKFMYGTGTRVEIPDGHYGMVVPRSSIGSKQGFVLRNTVGIIDSDYRGEIFLAVDGGKLKCDANYLIGTRVAQLIIQPYTRVPLVRVHYHNALGDTSRGSGGFGSTGK